MPMGIPLGHISGDAEGGRWMPFAPLETSRFLGCRLGMTWRKAAGVWEVFKGGRFWIPTFVGMTISICNSPGLARGFWLTLFEGLCYYRRQNCALAKLAPLELRPNRAGLTKGGVGAGKLGG